MRIKTVKGNNVYLIKKENTFAIVCNSLLNEKYDNCKREIFGKYFYSEVIHITNETFLTIALYFFANSNKTFEEMCKELESNGLNIKIFPK